MLLGRLADGKQETRSEKRDPGTGHGKNEWLVQGLWGLDVCKIGRHTDTSWRIAFEIVTVAERKRDRPDQQQKSRAGTDADMCNSI
jgi:hypothetical protein